MFKTSPRLSRFLISRLKEGVRLKFLAPTSRLLLSKFSRRKTWASNLKNWSGWTLKWPLLRTSWTKLRKLFQTKKFYKLREIGWRPSSREIRRSWRTSFWGPTTSAYRTDCSNWRAWSSKTKSVRTAYQKSSRFWHVSIPLDGPLRIKSSWPKEKSIKKPSRKLGRSREANGLQARCSWERSCSLLSDLFASSIVSISWKRNGRVMTFLI